MISEDKLKSIVEEVVASLGQLESQKTQNAALKTEETSAMESPTAVPSAPVQGALVQGALVQNISEQPSAQIQESEESLEDLSAVDLKKELLVPEAKNSKAYLAFKETTSSRLGIWRSGARPLTRSLLRFRADHAVAQDAVFNNVSEDFTKKLGIESFVTRCKDKDEFLTRPDLGRQLPQEELDRLKVSYPNPSQVQIYIADGLSSVAVETNAQDTFLSIQQGLQSHGISVAKPFFLKFGRVPSMDCIAEVIQAEVMVLLVGERPGLATGESMSCYMAYKPYVDMPEARRTVISNIHKGGTPAIEAGAHIADIIKKMLDQKASGLDLE